ncbi:flavin reductase family protein [Mycobacterium sp. AMU20-3851]|uniref:flavin reductase family protein n=1 Tax=Mycobacterium sp. AMU20-3851 TaxID=3122055 RepID=UPI00375400C3
MTNARQHDETDDERPIGEHFKNAFRRHPGGVAVITADCGSGPVGLTATSVTSLSADPPRLIFTVTDASSSAPTLIESDTAVVHLLDAHDLALAQLCATSGIDRFADTTLWDRLPSGEPYFPSAADILLIRSIEKIRTAGSTIVIADVIEARRRPEHVRTADGSRLVYQDRTWHSVGEHSSITANIHSKGLASKS